MRLRLGLAAASGASFAAAPASAFGLRTHLYIAEAVLEDLTPDCCPRPPAEASGMAPISLT